MEKRVFDILEIFFMLFDFIPCFFDEETLILNGIGHDIDIRIVLVENIFTFVVRTSEN